jgi:DNA topoisomerase II
MEEGDHGYERLKLRDHILKRSETYIGSMEAEAVKTLSREGEQLVLREHMVVPGLLKIFDEIVVNAADNKQRDPGMTQLSVQFLAEGPDAGGIQVRNNGKGLPVAMHPTEKVWIPALVFGQLLTGSNFNDKKKKTVGGRNGFGAKLANIFSTRFRLRTGDGEKQLELEWSDHMSEEGKPRVRKCKSQFTEVTFWPDYSLFGMSELSAGVRQLMERRVCDIAGCTPSSLTVKLNSAKLPSTFAGYCDMIEAPTHVYDKCDRWEICVMPSTDKEFTHYSFVNSIHTRLGGTHVEHVRDQLCRVLAEQLKAKHQLELRKGLLKEGMLVVVNCLIENPTFEGQCKHQLTLKAPKFGSRWAPSKTFLRKLKEGGPGSVLERLVEMATAKQDQALSQQDGKKKVRVNVAKLSDARLAGSGQSMRCFLIVTEGDSALALALAGKSASPDPTVIGAMPLRGKLLNVRAQSRKMLLANKEIQDLVKALGLQYGKEYRTEEDFRSLRYGGGVLLMADQDFDGFHIGGLILNLFEHLWPSLMQRPGFFRRMQTPIVKVSRGPTVRQFFRLSEFEAWYEEHQRDTPKWTVKYYKGLGTSTAKEGKEYFADLGRHMITFVGSDQTHAALEKAFHKDKADERKAWLREMSVDKLQQEVEVVERQTIPEFVDDQLVQFSLYDNYRSIPSVIHGLKPSQLKIVWLMLQKNMNKDVKVAQLAPQVAQHMGYHHGEENLNHAVINMAQDYVGAPNINLLVPSGQFGTRLAGGKDAASPRYIFTRLHPLARLLFRQEDDPILPQQTEEGQTIEPKMVAPIVPFGLITGGSGIGTGWSSTVPPHHPQQVLDNTRRLLRGEPLAPLVPFFRGFTGQVVLKEGGFHTHGVARWDGKTKVEVTDLPIGVWVTTYRQHLEKLVERKVVKDFVEDHTDRLVRFEIKLAEAPGGAKKRKGGAADSEQAAKKSRTDTVTMVSRIGQVPTYDLPPELVEKLKLTKSFSTTNMHLFSAEGKIVKYAHIDEIFRLHYVLRLSMYYDRKEYQLAELLRTMRELEERARFVDLVLAQTVVIMDAEQDALLRALTEEHRFADPEKLLEMKVGQLTATAVAKLRERVDKARQEHQQLADTTPEQLWERDLAELESGLAQHWSEMPSDDEPSATQKKKSKPS